MVSNLNGESNRLDATATGADEIGKAMQKVGGTAGSLKIPFEEVSSWVAVISSRTRESAETVGQGVKSILARVQSLKENGFDETDGTKVNQVAKALNTVGIKLIDETGNFRNFGTVLNELGKTWQNLDGRTKAYLATTIAGTYQQSRFLNLMEGYGDVVKLNAQALDSAGTTQKKFDLYLQGTEAKLNELKDTWQAVWMSTFKSKDLQNIIGGLNNLAKGFEFVINHVGILPTTLGAATTAFLLLNSTTRSSILNFGMLSTSLIKTGDSLPIVTGNARVAQSALYNLTLAGRAAGAGLTIFGNIAKGVFSFITTTALPVAAIMAVSFAIEKVTSAISDANQKQQEAKQKQDDLVKSYSSNSDQIEKLASKYSDLSNQVTAGKISNSNQDYLDTMNQLGKLMPDLVVSEDEHGNKILASADAVKKELDYAKQLKEIQDKTTIANFEKDLDSQASKIDTIIKNIDKYKENAKALASSPMVISGKSQYFDEGSVLDAQRQQASQERELQLALQNSKNYIQDKAKAYMDIDGTTQKLSSSQQKLIASYIDESVASKKNIKDGNDFKQFLSDTTNKAAELAKILAKLPNNITDILSLDEISKLSGKQVDALRQVGLDVKNNGTNWDEYTKILQKAKIPSREIAQIIYALSNSLKDNTKSQKDYATEVQKTIDTEMQKASGAEKILGTTKNLLDQTKDQILVYQQLSSMESISADQKQQLADVTGTLSAMYPEYIKNGELNISQIQKEVSADEILLKAINDVKDGHAKAEETMTLNTAIQTKARIQMIKDQIASYQKLITTIESSYEDTGMSGAKSKAYHDASSKVSDLQSQLDDLTKSYDDQIKKLSDTQNSTNETIYVTDKYKNSIEELNTALEHLKTIQQQYPKYSDEYRNALQEENKLIQQQIDLTKSQAANLKQQIDSGVIQQTGMITKSNSNGSDTSSVGSSAKSGSYNGQYADYINQAATKYGVDPNLVAAIIQQESGFQQTRNGATLSSPAGALGLMQLMPGTAASLGVNPNDAYQNILGGTKYISQLLSQFGGDVAKAVAGYNWGPAHAAIRNGNTSQYPAETQNYVKAVLANYSNYSGGATPTLQAGTNDTSKSAANMAQDIDQAKAQLLQYYQTIDQKTNELLNNNLEIVNSFVAKFDHAKSQIDADLAKIDYNQNVVSEYSVTWRDLEVQREQDYGKQIDLEKQAINYLNQQIATNNQLTNAQKQTLSDDILQRQQDIISLEQKIYDQRVQMANETIDTYKKALSTMKDAATKTIDDEINAINKASDQASYQKKLSDAQKSAQDIQTQINQLSLDDSYAAKKKIADLKTQLTSQQDSITQMIADNDKQQRIDNLNTQKQALSDYYDNMINDETKFAQMRSNIIADNTLQIYSDLQSFSQKIQSNVKILGTGVVNTIIAAINKVNGYIGDNQLSPIASLDSGGLLPSWGSGGKMLMAHEKEMVLNKSDTSNVLKIVNVARDFFKNVVKMPDLSGLKPAITGGNTFQVFFQVDKMTGSENEAKSFVTQFVNGIKSKGGSI